MQIFFVSPDYLTVRNALAGIPGQRTHGWQDSDNGGTQIIGVVELFGPLANGEAVAEALENAGILVLPDHRFGGQVGQPIVQALGPYKVNAADTTVTAMQKVQAVSGFPPHRARRYS